MARIHEGSLPLLDGESLGSFHDAARGAVRGYYETEQSIGGAAPGWVWIEEIFDDFIIAEVHAEGQPRRLEKVDFTRDASGVFSFAEEPAMVRRVVSFVPVSESTAEAVVHEFADPDRAPDGQPFGPEETACGVVVRVGDIASIEAAARLEALVADDIATLERMIDHTLLRFAKNGTNESARSAAKAHLRVSECAARFRHA